MFISNEIICQCFHSFFPLQSSIALEQMKRDLNEFGSTVQRDTSSAVATSAEVIQHNLKVKTLMIY